MSISKTVGEQLVCPLCWEHLVKVSQNLVCKKCNKHWPVKNGVPHFINESPYWGGINVKKMKKIVEKISQENWRDVLSRSKDQEIQKLYQFTANLNRANWQLLIEPKSSKRALDLGAETGSISQALSSRFEEVYAVEPVQVMIDFMRMRFQQENVDNVILIKSAISALPFSESFFDFIALNGVLGWLPLAEPDKKPDMVQLRTITTLCRLLRPGGFLYIGIENRIGFKQFFGTNDHHAGIPWVGIMPRKLATLYSLKKTGESYRNYLYSARGYRKMLEKSGLVNISIYVAIPGYNEPNFIVPLKKEIYQFYFDRFYSFPKSWYKKSFMKFAVRIGLLGYMSNDFIIFAQRPTGGLGQSY